MGLSSGSSRSHCTCWVFKVVFDSSRRWLCVAYVLMAIIYIIGISTEVLEASIGRFWYTDPYRTAACVALFAIPIATVGIGFLMSLIQSLLERAFYGRGQDVRTICIVFSRIAVLVICAFLLHRIAVNRFPIQSISFNRLALAKLVHYRRC